MYKTNIQSRYKHNQICQLIFFTNCGNQIFRNADNYIAFDMLAIQISEMLAIMMLGMLAIIISRQTDNHNLQFCWQS